MYISPVTAAMLLHTGCMEGLEVHNKVDTETSFKCLA